MIIYHTARGAILDSPYLQHLSAVAQHGLIVDEPVRVGGTIFVAENHPVAHETTNVQWIKLSKRVLAIANGSE